MCWSMMNFWILFGLLRMLREKNNKICGHSGANRRCDSALWCVFYPKRRTKLGSRCYKFTGGWLVWSVSVICTSLAKHSAFSCPLIAMAHGRCYQWNLHHGIWTAARKADVWHEGSKPFRPTGLFHTAHTHTHVYIYIYIYIFIAW